ncbi:MAG: PQQ-binding-like beta-propeller repeat protein [Planctomycetes bacterium]|nr:PQQ-binding-like beta-propeller repeat protein [Planctomycetota bacterium]
MVIRGANGCGTLVLAAGLAALAGCAKPPQWLQWGGPNRNFMVEAKGLADEWPEDGPPRLWHRELGDGYSTVVADGDRLYTMYRTDEEEFTVALEADTGKTIWEHENPSPVTDLMTQFGPGPHSTPLVVGHRLYTIGSNSVMHCFDKRSGKVLWKHDLVSEFGAPVPGYGYACSPIRYRDTVIVPVDRKRPSDEESAEESADRARGEPEEGIKGQTLVAFDQVTGAVAWKNLDFPISYSSPILIDFDGLEQLVLLTEKEIIGANPADGALLWRHEFDKESSHLTTPLWNGDGLLFFSAAYDSGGRVIKLTPQNGKIVPEELWFSRKLRIHHGNAIRIGDYVYGSSGDFGPAFFVGMSIKTGEVAWRERGFKKATCVYADGKVVLLDEDGTLALVTVTPEGLTVHSKCTVAERTAWAAPTLVGAKLYVRDRKHIMAFDLS